MEEYIKVSGKTVEDALIEASIELGTTSDNIEYRVVERESKGFLGLGAKKAVIEARRKQSQNEETDVIGEVFNEKKKSSSVRSQAQKKTDSEKTQSSPSSYAAAKSDVKKNVPEKSVSDQGYVRKNTSASQQNNAKASYADKDGKKEDTLPKKKESVSSQESVPVQNKPSYEENNKTVSDKERTPRVPADPKAATERAVNFLSNMFNAMGMEVTIDTSFEEGTLSIELSGENMGSLIGKRGQTLDSIQYLTSLVVNKGKASYVKVKIDTENYRERRAATLENLARNIAFKVKKTRRPVYLEPMNPYERRIIHSALQNDPYVTTHSEGEEPNRKVVVTLKRREYQETEERKEE